MKAYIAAGLQFLTGSNVLNILVVTIGIEATYLTKGKSGPVSRID